MSFNKILPLKKKMPCVRSYQKKYTSRNSPPYPANECKNTTKIGNDGTLYESRRASNGVHRWVKYSYKRSPKKSKSPRKSPKKSKTKSPIKFKKTLTNKKPKGTGWILDGTGYDLIRNQREYFWYKK